MSHAVAGTLTMIQICKFSQPAAGVDGAIQHRPHRM